MANKTILDFSAVTSAITGDVFYLIRGTGSGRDKKITLDALFSNVGVPALFTGTFEVRGTFKYTAGGTASITVSATNSKRNVLTVQATSTGDMVDGFGCVETFQIRDTAGVDNPIGYLGFVRDGADNSGKFVVGVYSAGSVADRFTVDKAGNGVFTGGLTAAGATFSKPITVSPDTATEPATLTYNATDTSTPNSALVLRKTTSADMVDGFGVDINAQIRDSAGVTNNIAVLRFTRDGADNSGKFALRIASAGTFADRFTVDKSGNGVFTGGLTATTGTFSGAVSAANGTFAGLLSVTSANANPGILTYTSALTSDAVNVLVLKHKTSGNMADGFGAQLYFSIEDDTSGEVNIGRLRFSRDGADADGKFAVRVGPSMNDQFTVDKGGTIRSTGNLVAASVADAGAWLPIPGMARFGHASWNTAAGFGYVQNSDGQVYIEAPTGKAILFRNGADPMNAVMDVTATGVTLGSDLVPTGADNSSKVPTTAWVRTLFGAPIQKPAAGVSVTLLSGSTTVTPVTGVVYVINMNYNVTLTLNKSTAGTVVYVMGGAVPSHPSASEHIVSCPIPGGWSSPVVLQEGSAGDKAMAGVMLISTGTGASDGYVVIGGVGKY